MQVSIETDVVKLDSILENRSGMPFRTYWKKNRKIERERKREGGGRENEWKKG